MMTITTASEADVPALCALLALLFTQEAEFQPDAAKQAAGLRAILRDENVGRVLVMRNNGTPIGMVSLLFVPSTALGGRAALLEDMIVHPDHRKHGNGSALLNAAINAARIAGCLRITLLTDTDNADAQRFYSRHGFARSAMSPMRLVFPPTLNCDTL
jgi:GNAT superfamily N-acetyltransferase